MNERNERDIRSGNDKITSDHILIRFSSFQLFNCEFISHSFHLIPFLLSLLWHSIRNLCKSLNVLCVCTSVRVCAEIVRFNRRNCTVEELQQKTNKNRINYVTRTGSGTGIIIVVNNDAGDGQDDVFILFHFLFRTNATHNADANDQRRSTS